MFVKTCAVVEVCTEDSCGPSGVGVCVSREPCEEPGEGVGRPDALPLKLNTEPARTELLTPGVYVKELPDK